MVKNLLLAITSLLFVRFSIFNLQNAQEKELYILVPIVLPPGGFYRYNTVCIGRQMYSWGVWGPSPTKILGKRVLNSYILYEV